jgi:hypothetical protein
MSAGRLPPALLPELLDWLRQAWPELFPGQRRPRALDCVIQGTGVGKIIGFVLADGQASPSCVVKLPRSAGDNGELLHELHVINELRRRGGALAQATLPHPLAAPLIQGRQLVVEALLPGELFSSVVPVGGDFHLDTARRHLGQIRDWYVGLQRATWPAPEPLTASDVESLCLIPIRRARQEAELRPQEVQFLDDLAARARRLEGQRLPLGFVHGDLRPGNVLIHRGALRVLDWQFGSLRALPLLDWFEFAFRYYCDAGDLPEITGDQDAYRAAFADVFLGAHPYADLLAQETDRCAEALGVPDDAVDLLLAMWLVDNTNKYMDFLGQRAERGYLYLMSNPPGGPFRTFRQQLRRQVYACLLGQLASSRRALSTPRPSLDGFRSLSRTPG